MEKEGLSSDYALSVEYYRDLLSKEYPFLVDHMLLDPSFSVDALVSELDEKDVPLDKFLSSLNDSNSFVRKELKALVLSSREKFLEQLNSIETIRANLTGFLEKLRASRRQLATFKTGFIEAAIEINDERKKFSLDERLREEMKRVKAIVERTKEFTAKGGAVVSADEITDPHEALSVIKSEFEDSLTQLATLKTISYIQATVPLQRRMKKQIQKRVDDGISAVILSAYAGHKLNDVREEIVELSERSAKISDETGKSVGAVFEKMLLRVLSRSAQKEVQDKIRGILVQNLSEKKEEIEAARRVRDLAKLLPQTLVKQVLFSVYTDCLQPMLTNLKENSVESMTVLRGVLTKYTKYVTLIVRRGEGPETNYGFNKLSIPNFILYYSLLAEFGDKTMSVIGEDLVWEEKKKILSKYYNHISENTDEEFSTIASLEKWYRFAFDSKSLFTQLVLYKYPLGGFSIFEGEVKTAEELDERVASWTVVPTFEISQESDVITNLGLSLLKTVSKKITMMSLFRPKSMQAFNDIIKYTDYYFALVHKCIHDYVQSIPSSFFRIKSVGTPEASPKKEVASGSRILGKRFGSIKNFRKGVKLESIGGDRKKFSLGIKKLKASTDSKDKESDKSEQQGKYLGAEQPTVDNSVSQREAGAKDSTDGWDSAVLRYRLPENIDKRLKTVIENDVVSRVSYSEFESPRRLGDVFERWVLAVSSYGTIVKFLRGMSGVMTENLNDEDEKSCAEELAKVEEICEQARKVYFKRILHRLFFGREIYDEEKKENIKFEYYVFDTIKDANWVLGEDEIDNGLFVEKMIPFFEEFAEKLEELENTPARDIKMLKDTYWEILLSLVLSACTRVERCNQAGRMLMTTNVKELFNIVAKILYGGDRDAVPFEKYMKVDEYVKAFYYEGDDLLNWIRRNKGPYSLRRMEMLIKSNVDRSKKEVSELLSQVKKIYEDG